jgi:hypothetical protein
MTDKTPYGINHDHGSETMDTSPEPSANRHETPAVRAYREHTERGAGHTVATYEARLAADREAFDRVKRERDAAEKALADLVACKDLKDRLDVTSGPEEFIAIRDEYERRKPLAWAEARRLIGDAAPHGGAAGSRACPRCGFATLRQGPLAMFCDRRSECGYDAAPPASLTIAKHSGIGPVPWPANLPNPMINFAAAPPAPEGIDALARRLRDRARTTPADALGVMVPDLVALLDDRDALRAKLAAGSGAGGLGVTGSIVVDGGAPFGKRVHLGADLRPEEKA